MRLTQALRNPFFLRFSLRTNLLLLLACFLVFLIADRGREIIQERNERIVQAHADIFASAQDGARRQADVVSQARAILRLATGVPESSGTSLTACQMPFRRIVEDRPWLLRLSLFNIDGEPLCTSGDRPIAQNIADREYFQEVLQSRKFVLSDYIISRLDQRPIVVAAMPRMSRSSVVTVLLAIIDVSWLNRLAAETGSRSNAEVLLLDSDGTVIAAYPEPERWVGMSLSAKPEFWNVLGGEDGVFESTALGGGQRIVGHVKLADTEAILMVSRERRDVLASANREAQQSVAKIATIALICFVVIWLGGERLVLKPIKDLTRSAARLGAGDLGARVETERLSPELRLLGQTFNAMAAQLAEHDTELQRANARLSELAATDGLTGIANRRRFDEQIEAEWRRASRSGESIGLLAIDVDHFKKFNDRYGHLHGDSCLKIVAKLLRSAGRRPGEVAARIGGEEFAVLLPGARGEDVASLAEAIRAGVALLGIEHRDSTEGRVTVSIGVATCEPRPGQSARTLLDAADAALYRAKRSGRNRVAFDRSPVALAS